MNNKKMKITQIKNKMKIKQDKCTRKKLENKNK